MEHGKESFKYSLAQQQVNGLAAGHWPLEDSEVFPNGVASAVVCRQTETLV